MPQNSHDRQCETFPGLQLAHPLRSFNQRPDLGRGVVCRDVIGLVAKEDLAILEADAGGAQPMPMRALEVMNQLAFTNLGSCLSDCAKPTSGKETSQVRLCAAASRRAAKPTS